MVRTLRLLIWSVALVALWASAEQGANVTLPVSDGPQVTTLTRAAMPQGVWGKLRHLFSPPAEATSTGTSRKGSQ